MQGTLVLQKLLIIPLKKLQGKVLIFPNLKDYFSEDETNFQMNSSKA